MKQPFPYYGGKQKLKKLILSLIPNKKDFDIFVETNLGGGTIFWEIEPSKIEIINDLNNSLIKFYEVCSNDFENLKLKIDATLRSRTIFNLSTQILKNPENYSDLEIAWSIFINLNIGFGGKLLDGYGYSKNRNNGEYFNNKKQNFTIEHKNRLNNVEIECIDFLRLIKNRDTERTFFYIDPPYFNSYCGHYDGYSEQDFKNLLESLSNIKGMFLLSSYNSEILQEYVLKNNWKQKIVEQQLVMNINNGSDKIKTKFEVLTYNY